MKRTVIEDRIDDEEWYHYGSIEKDPKNNRIKINGEWYVKETPNTKD